ncbi:MAG: phosphatase PAP2 family protein [Nannocystaceae bacterium]
MPDLTVFAVALALLAQEPLSAPDEEPGVAPIENPAPTQAEPAGAAPEAVAEPPAPKPSSEPVQQFERDESNMSQGALVKDDLEPPHPARVRWVLDSAVTLGGVGTFVVLDQWVSPQLPVSRPAQEPMVGRVDATALGVYRPGAATASDILMFTGIAAPAIYHGVEAGLRKRDFGIRYGTDMLIYAETLAVNLLVTETLKFAVGRYRPFTHINPDAVDPEIRDKLVEDQGEVDSSKSFPSGHASMSFAAAVAGSTLLTMKLAGRKTPAAKAALAVTWIASLGLASTTAVLRVVAGKHYPSDITAGALIGSTIGAVVPLAHLRPRRWSRRRARVDVMPSAIGARGLTIQGQF